MGSLFPLTADQRAAYERIIANNEAALARMSANAPMRSFLEGRVAHARQELGA